MHLFLDIHDPRPGHRRRLRDRGLGTRPHLHDLGDLQLRPGRHGHAGGLHVLAVPLRLELAGAAGSLRRARRAGAAVGRRPLRRHHARAAEDGRGHQDRGHHRHHARADRVGPVDLEPGVPADRQPVLRRGGQVQGPRRLRHRPRGHRPRLRRADRRGHPPALHEHPDRRGHAGRGRQPRPAAAQRRTARAAGRLLVGARRRRWPRWPASSSPRSAAARSTSTC